MSDGKSDQSLEPKGGPAGKSEAKASATSPKADGKPAAGAPTEFEKKPKLSKQERRELQVFVSLHPNLYNLHIFISCFRSHFCNWPCSHQICAGKPTRGKGCHERRRRARRAPRDIQGRRCLGRGRRRRRSAGPHLLRRRRGQIRPGRCGRRR